MGSKIPPATISPIETPFFRDALAVWAKIGVLSFGGPAGQIALMHRILVEERRWIAEDRFLHALNFCMLLPGPEAMQLATYVGWLLHGTLGGLAAGLLFVLPGAFVVLALSIAYALFGHVPLVEAAFIGIKAAVLVIVIEALLRVARRALRRPYDWGIAAAAFVAIFCFAVPFPLVIASAVLLGYLLADTQAAAPSQAQAEAASVPLSETLRTASLWLALWIVPLLLVTFVFGRDHITTDISLFFSKLGLPPRRGAQTRLWPAWSRDHALGDVYALLSVDLRGRSLYRASQQEPATRRRPCGVTAAVVGVILNLSLWFALHVFFAKVGAEWRGPLRLWLPDLSTIDLEAVVLAGLSAILLLWLRAGIVSTPGLAGAAALQYLATPNVKY